MKYSFNFFSQACPDDYTILSNLATFLDQHPNVQSLTTSLIIVELQKILDYSDLSSKYQDIESFFLDCKLVILNVTYILTQTYLIYFYYRRH